MTREECIEQRRQLANLVNVRRIQLGREPLQHARIMRTVRRCFGKEPPLKYTPRYDLLAWYADEPVPYSLTRKGLNYLIGERAE